MVNNAEIWRLVSAMYLHAGVVHVVLNMMSVVAQATRLEQDFGAPRVAAVWIISGTFSMCVHKFYMRVKFITLLNFFQRIQLHILFIFEFLVSSKTWTGS